MKLLNIEDSELDYELMLHHLKRGGMSDIYSERIETEEQLREALKREKWNLIISDYNVPGFNPMTALAIVREISQNLPFIVVSGLVGEESVADMMKAGVEDFVIKSRLERLTPVVKRALREFEIHEQEMKSRVIAKKALESKEEMLAIVYHDIKNPLAAIQLDAQLLELLSYKEPSVDMMEDLRIQSKRILKTVDRLKNLVSDLLEHNKPIQDAEFEHSFIIRKSLHNPIHVLNEVLDSYKPLIQEKNLSIKKTIIQRKMLSSFDKDRIFQVLSNLLSNALKYSPVGGEIIIELKEMENGDNIFSITDNGRGILSDDLTHIFEKYWTSGSGNGLGLYICKSIVESHEGIINAENLPGGGTRFWFLIPSNVPAENFQDNEINLKKMNVDRSSQNIFIIDDDEDLREVMTWAIEKEGYKVFSYSNARVALDDLNVTKCRPNLIVLDFHMDEMNGKDFLELKNSHSKINIKDCPVVMVSAAPVVVKEKINPAFYKEVLLKPLNLNKLITTVNKYSSF